MRFGSTVPNLLYQEKQGVQSAYALDRVEFGVVQAHRTFSNHIIAEIPRSVEFYYMSSGWFDYTEPSLPGEARCTGCLCTSSG